jgi:FkbM family methyltransferase
MRLSLAIVLVNLERRFYGLNCVVTREAMQNKVTDVFSARAAFHWPRIRHALGKPLRLGERQFRVRGYLSNNFAIGLTHEPHLLEAFRRAMAARSGAVIDVGVNTGQTLLKLLAIDPSRRYVGFEPQVGCCFFVDQFLRDNKLRTHRIICLALGSENGLLPFYASSPVDVFGSLVPRSTQRYDSEFIAQFVPVRIGDEVLEELGLDAPGIIKVDVEGAETQVFEGLRGTIGRARPICFFEVLPNHLGTEGTTIDADTATANREASKQLMRYFTDFAYQIRQIAADGSEHVIDSFELDDVSNYRGCDYVAYPNAV